MEALETFTEIKFSCGTCGQHMVADAAAAGQAAECPNCRQPVTIPAPRTMYERSYGEPAPTETRETRPDVEEQNDSPQPGRFEAVLEECERLKSVATHAQTELKTFQAERLTLKTELAQLRQRLPVLENQATAGAAETTRWQGVAEAAKVRAASLENDLSISRQRTTAAETQIAAKEQELAAVRASLAAAEAQGHSNQAEVVSLQDESSLLRKDLDAARRDLAAAAEIRTRLEKSEAQLSEAQARLRSSEDSAKALAKRGEELAIEAAGFRDSLKKSKTGRELIELRAKLASVETEHQREEAAARQSAMDLQKSEAAQHGLRELVKATRHQLEQAEKRAEAGSEDRVKSDNDLLRGIISRQNEELAHRHSELVRLKSARFAVRILYALFAVGLVALGFLVVELLPRLKF